MLRVNRKRGRSDLRPNWKHWDFIILLWYFLCGWLEDLFSLNCMLTL